MPRSKTAHKAPFFRRFSVRIRLVAIGFGLLALLCISRLYYLQILQGDYYAERAANEFTLPGTLFDRGAIYFTTKDGAHIAAATTHAGIALGVNPQKLPATSTDQVYRKLSDITSVSAEDFFAKAKQTNRMYVPLVGRLSTTTGARIQSQKLPGVVVTADRWRYYPGNTLAAQTVGFVAFNNDHALAGRYGLERQYNDTLERREDQVYANFFVELFAGATTMLAGSGRGDIVTTIEPSVEAELERELAAYAAAWSPTAVGGIIMDPRTGAIVAMASLPTFDPNTFAQADPATFKNPLVSNVYEMGSIIKPLTVAAGLDAGVITEESTYNDAGCIYLSSYPICNYDSRARGPGTPIQEILSQSLNVGASHIAGVLGHERMREYFIDRYAIGTTTGIDLPSEVMGITNNLKSPRDLEYAQASFGQGIAMTPMETIRALATLANGGYLVTPHVGRAVIDAQGFENDLVWPEKRQVLKPETVAILNRMLTKVVDTKLANGRLKMEHYSIAAKTGTAQIAAPSGGYLDSQYLHSFFGYFPSYDAKYIIFLYAFKPQGVKYASESWSDRFGDLVQFLINYYQLPPDR
jgi:stage V sporulation protein D (sporulation-specific penicillin-binding protein)